MPDLTTAQRLAAYRDELAAAGFSADLIGPWVVAVAPASLEDVTVAHDLDEVGPIASVRINMVPRVDPESIRKIGEELKWLLWKRPFDQAEGDGTPDA